MKRITNISITDPAARVLHREKSGLRLSHGDVFALVYVFSFVNAAGTTVEGFRPGYMAGSWSVEHLSSRWLLARLPDGTEFYFLPRFVWNAQERYVVDLLGKLFSIRPVRDGLNEARWDSSPTR